MKDMVAMIVAVARDFKTHRVRPAAGPDLRLHVRRGGRRQLGAPQWLVDHHPELFSDATEAISEVGGFSVPLGDDRRAYLVAAAEKGVAWATSHGHRPGRARFDDQRRQRRHPDRQGGRRRSASHEFPITHTATVDALLAAGSPS